MHFAVDIREACRARRAGKGQWTYGFVQELLSRDHAFTLFTDADVPAEWKPLIEKKNNVRVMCLNKKGLSWHLAVARAVRADRTIDLYVATVSFIVPFLLGRSKTVVTVVHDLIAFMNEPHDRRATWIERLTLGRAVRSSEKIFTVSETTKRDLLKKIPSLNPAKVMAIFAAPHFARPHASEKADIILCVGTLCPRKNQHRLIRAYSSLPAELRSRFPLVLCGARGWHDDDIVDLAAGTPGVEWKQYVPDTELEDLYRRCALFAFPSTYEGFGLPILEAMQRSIPVITSDRGSMKEVAGDAALLIEPESISAISAGMQSLLTDEPLRKKYASKGSARAAGFSWEKTVDLFLAALD